MSFSDPNSCVGAVTYGQATVGKSGRTAQGFIPEFEAGLPEGRLRVEEFARQLGEFYSQQWGEVHGPETPGSQMVFVVGGFNVDEHFGRVYIVQVPNHPEPIEQNPGPDQFGITWGGQREIIDRIIQGIDSQLAQALPGALGLNPQQAQTFNQLIASASFPIPIGILPLQDCVDLAILFIRTTIDAQKLGVVLRGVGGPIDVATITRREGMKFVQRKKIKGEDGESYVP